MDNRDFYLAIARYITKTPGNTMANDAYVKDPAGWITMNGNHIPLAEGQTPREAGEAFLKDKKQNSSGKKPSAKKERIPMITTRYGAEWDDNANSYRIFEAGRPGRTVDFVPDGERLSDSLYTITKAKPLSYQEIDDVIDSLRNKGLTENQIENMTDKRLGLEYLRDDILAGKGLELKEKGQNGFGETVYYLDKAEQKSSAEPKANGEKIQSTIKNLNAPASFKEYLGNNAKEVWGKSINQIVEKTGVSPDYAAYFLNSDDGRYFARSLKTHLNYGESLDDAINGQIKEYSNNFIAKLPKPGSNAVEFEKNAAKNIKKPKPSSEFKEKFGERAKEIWEASIDRITDTTGADPFYTINFLSGHDGRSFANSLKTQMGYGKSLEDAIDIQIDDYSNLFVGKLPKPNKK